MAYSMVASNYRQEARAAMNGRTGTLVLAYLIYMLITGVPVAAGFFPVVGSIFGSIATIVITGPFSLSLAAMTLWVIERRIISVGDIFYGFTRFLTAFCAFLINNLFIFLWSLLFIIPGILKAYSYSMTYYILADDPNVTADEARIRSMELMRGNRFRLFCLQLSFLGWFILCALTLGVLFIWVGPYYNTAVASFYKNILYEESHSGAMSVAYGSAYGGANPNADAYNADGSAGPSGEEANTIPSAAGDGGSAADGILAEGEGLKEEPQSGGGEDVHNG